MKLTSRPRFALALVALALGAVAHADTGKTRDEVRAETMAAIRDGTMTLANGLTGREMFPGLYLYPYPTAPAPVSRTRDEVRAETLAAIRDGTEMLGNGFTGRDIFPGLYAAAPVVAGKTRDEVKAELAAAERSGDMLASGRITMTLREEFPQAYGRH
jgi:hypothetical protein